MAEKIEKKNWNFIYYPLPTFGACGILDFIRSSSIHELSMKCKYSKLLPALAGVLLGSVITVFPSQAANYGPFASPFDQNLIPQIWDQLKNPASDVWKVFMSHGHGGYGQMSFEDIEFLKDYRDKQLQLDENLQRYENVKQRLERTQLSKREISQLSAELKETKKKIRDLGLSINDLCKNYRQLSKTPYEYLERKIDFNDVVELSVNRAPYEVMYNSIITIFPKQLFKIFNGSWIDKHPFFAWTSLAVQAQKAFSQFFADESEPSVVQSDPDHLTFMIQTSQKAPYLNLFYDPSVMVNAPIQTEGHNFYVNEGITQRFLVEMREVYGHLVVQSVVPVLRGSEIFDKGEPVPLTSFLEQTLKKDYPEVAIPSQDDLLQDLAQQQVARFLLIYVRNGALTLVPQALKHFWDHYKLPSVDLDSVKNRINQLCGMGPLVQGQPFPKQTVESFITGELIAIGKTQPPFQTHDEYQALESQLKNLPEDDIDFITKEGFAKYLGVKDFQKWNVRADAKYQRLQNEQRELERLSNRQQQIDDQLRYQLQPKEEIQRQMQELTEEETQLRTGINQINTFLRENKERVVALLKLTSQIGDSTRHHSTGKVRRYITHALLDLRSTFANPAAEPPTARILGRYRNDSGNAVSIIEYQTNHSYPSSLTSNVSTDLSYQKTDKLIVIVDHHKDQINRFVTSFPSPGDTLIRLNLNEVELLRNQNFAPLPPPKKKDPPAVRSAHANLEARVAQLSPEELEMWQALNGES